MPEYLTLTPKSNLAVKEITGNGFDAKVRIVDNSVVVSMKNVAQHDVKVNAYDVNGSNVGESVIPAGSDSCDIKLSTDGIVVIVKVSDVNNSKVFKLAR